MTSSCFERIRFNNVYVYYLNHMKCGTKQYGIFEVSSTHFKVFPMMEADTMTVGGKLYQNVILIEMPDTLTGNYYGVDYNEVGKTTINCKELQHLNEISPIRNFYFLNKNKPFVPS